MHIFLILILCKLYRYEFYSNTTYTTEAKAVVHELSGQPSYRSVITISIKKSTTLKTSTRQIGQLQIGHLTDLGCNPGEPSADKDPLKAENLKTTTKPRLGLIESYIRYHGNCKYKSIC